MLSRILFKIPRNTALSFGAGVLFAVGWWCLIDANAVSSYWKFSDTSAVNGVHYVPAIFGTLALILLNAVTAEAMDFSDFDYSNMNGMIGPKITIFVAFLMAFGSLFGASYIFADKYMIQNPAPSPELISANPDGQQGQLAVKWPGVAVLLQNLLIFGSNMLMRFGRKFDS